MIKSMTAFSRHSHEDGWGSIVWELRSVNHRFLEMSLRLPEMLRQQEAKVRELISGHASRGKVEATLKFIPGEQLPFDLKLNHDLAAKLATLNAELCKHFPNASMNMAELFNWQGLLQTQDKNMEQVGECALQLLQTSLEDLVSTRQREGDKVAQFLLDRLQQIREEIKKVESVLPEAINASRDRIKERFAELKLEIDQARLEQEITWLLQKSDVAEELQRLEAHLQEVERILKKGGVAGRRLDFLMQELNREANTLSSKSSHALVTQAAIEMKVLVEQMREQVQNIE